MVYTLIKIRLFRLRGVDGESSCPAPAATSRHWQVQPTPPWKPNNYEISRCTRPWPKSSWFVQYAQCLVLREYKITCSRKGVVSGLTPIVRRSRSHLHRNKLASAKVIEHRNTLSASWIRSEFWDTFAPYAGKLRSSSKGERDPAALWDIYDGCILWLPLEYGRCKNSGPLAPPEGVLGHPILVLHVSVSGPENAVITSVTMRSFKDDGPETHPLFWRRYLKIGTANSQVEAELNGTLLGKAARERRRKGWQICCLR